MLTFSPDTRIILPLSSRQNILDHCRRALEAHSEGRAEKSKAFGLIFGAVSGKMVTVADCFPLKKNVRSRPPYKEYIDRMMAEHAIPSVTPMEQRGWVAEPAELFARIKECRTRGLELVGTYHMHRVGWENDPVRDTPTKLDGVLAAQSGLLMFIVSMVDPGSPIIRAFIEGVKEQEVTIG